MNKSLQIMNERYFDIIRYKKIKKKREDLYPIFFFFVSCHLTERKTGLQLSGREASLEGQRPRICKGYSVQIFGRLTDLLALFFVDPAQKKEQKKTLIRCVWGGTRRQVAPQVKSVQNEGKWTDSSKLTSCLGVGEGVVCKVGGCDVGQ